MVIKRKGGGRIDNLEELYKTESVFVYNYLLSLTKDPFLSEDLMQETFLRAYKGLKRFKGECTVSTWLCGIAKNLFIDYKRKHHNEELTDMAEKVAFKDSRPEDEIENLLLMECITNGLNEVQQDVFIMRYFEELSFKEIGVLLKKNENWACVTYARAKTKLKKMLEEQK